MAYEHSLSEEEKRELLRIARATLREYLKTGRIPPGAPHRPALVAPAAVFVSLHRGEELRGCIGGLGEDRPVFKAIQESAVAAASRDPRYSPVTEDELERLDIEISILGPRTAIAGPEEIEVGRHGVICSSGGRRGLLLPQVGSHLGCDGETFLLRTLEKGGLPEDWRAAGVTVEVFPAQVFAEKDFAPPR